MTKTTTPTIAAGAPDQPVQLGRFDAAADIPRTAPSRVLLRLAEVERRVCLKKTAIYRRIAEGTFPEPRKDGRRVTWYEADIEAYVATTPDLSGGDGPAKRRDA